MYASDGKINEAIELFREHGPVLRTSEVLEVGGGHNRTLYYMLEEGHITRPADEGDAFQPKPNHCSQEGPQSRDMSHFSAGYS